MNDQSTSAELISVLLRHTYTHKSVIVVANPRIGDKENRLVKLCIKSVYCVWSIRYRMPNMMEVFTNVWNDVLVPRVALVTFPILQVAEVDDMVQDDQCVPSAFCEFEYGEFWLRGEMNCKIFQGPVQICVSFLVTLTNQWPWPVKPGVLIDSKCRIFDIFVKESFLWASDWLCGYRIRLCASLIALRNDVTNGTVSVIDSLGGWGISVTGVRTSRTNMAIFDVISVTEWTAIRYVDMTVGKYDGQFWTWSVAVVRNICSKVRFRRSACPPDLEPVQQHHPYQHS